MKTDTSSQAYWNRVYQTKKENEVGWYQQAPLISLSLLADIGASPDQSVIDIGCGASTLADQLIEQGYGDIALLDCSEQALLKVKKRLGRQAEIPVYLAADIADRLDLGRQFNIWHDRAAFHFLVSKEARANYMHNLDQHLAANGHAIIGTFSLNGPKSCSGLEVVRYNQEKMQKYLPDHFSIIFSKRHVHVTPGGFEQEYLYFVIRRN